MSGKDASTPRDTLSLEGPAGDLTVIHFEWVQGRVYVTVDAPLTVRVKVTRGHWSPVVRFCGRAAQQAITAAARFRRMKAPTPQVADRDGDDARGVVVVPGSTPRVGPPIQRRANIGGTS